MSIGIPELLVIGIGLMFLVGTGFWIFALVDCATKEPDAGNTKLVWILIIVLTHLIGSILYLALRRPDRIRAYGR